MTWDLFITAFSLIPIPLFAIVIHIYACHTLQKLYDELSMAYDELTMAEADATFGMKKSYVKKYIEMLEFRNSFYVFLSRYLKEDIFRSHHFFCKGILPDFCNGMDSLYSR